MTTTQNTEILRLLRERGEHGLTAIEALNLVGCFRLAARISDLKAEGHEITSTLEEVPPNAKRVSVYRLIERPVAAAGEQTTWMDVA